jgi:hypothetical protein
MELLQKYPTQHWDWFELSRSHTITFDFIYHNPHFAWFEPTIYQNINITPEIVRKYPKYHWNWMLLNEHPNFMMSDLHSFHQFNYYRYSYNPNLTIDDITYSFQHSDNNDNNWNWYAVFQNKNISLNDIHLIEDHINFHGLSRNPNITIDFVKKFDVHLWNWADISQNSNITASDINQNLDLPWVWTYVSKNPNLDIKFVSQHHSKIDWFWLANNPCLCIDFIHKFPNEPWNWFFVSKHKNITFDIIQKNPQYKWCVSGISMNENVDTEIIEQYPDFPWDFRYISKNPNIDLDFIHKNISKLCFYFLFKPYINSIENMRMYMINDFCRKNKKQIQCIAFTKQIKKELFEIAYHPDLVFRFCFSQNEFQL